MGIELSVDPVALAQAIRAKRIFKGEPTEDSQTEDIAWKMDLNGEELADLVEAAGKANGNGCALARHPKRSAIPISSLSAPMSPAGRGGMLALYTIRRYYQYILPDREPDPPTEEGRHLCCGGPMHHATAGLAALLLALPFAPPRAAVAQVSYREVADTSFGGVHLTLRSNDKNEVELVATHGGMLGATVLVDADSLERWLDSVRTIARVPAPADPRDQLRFDGPRVQGRNERAGLQSELGFLRTIGGHSSTLVVSAWDVEYAPNVQLPVEMMLSRAEFDSFIALVQDAIATAKELTKKAPART